MAQAPPPFQPVPPRSSGTRVWLWILLISVGCCVLLCGGLGIVGYGAFNQMGSVAGCAMSYEMARASMLAYSMEHGGKLPDSATWQDDARPYYARIYAKNMAALKKAHMEGFFGPTSPEGDWSCRADGNRRTGMAFNAELSGKKVADVKNPMVTVLLFEVDRQGRNLSEPYKERPESDAPKLFGKSRPWLTVEVGGNGKYDGRHDAEEFGFDPKDALGD